jgi:hypothetical protein
MKPLSFVPWFLPTLILANPLLPRDLATIESTLSTISKSLSVLDNSIGMLGNASIPINTSANLVIANSGNVISAMTLAASTITNQTVLSVTDAINMQTTGMQLTAMIMTAIKELMSNQATINASGFGTEALSILSAQRNASQSFGKALAARVPPASVPVAQMLAGMNDLAYQMGILAFTPTQTAAATPTTTPTADRRTKATDTGVVMQAEDPVVAVGS